jgi:hypothetical protein
MVTVAARILGFAAAAWLAVVCPARACDLPAAETGMVASVIDGETLKLTDGRTVRLIGAKAPMPPLGWRGEDPWPFVDERRGAGGAGRKPAGGAETGRQPPRRVRSSAGASLRRHRRNPAVAAGRSSPRDSPAFIPSRTIAPA